MKRPIKLRRDTPAAPAVKLAGMVRLRPEAEILLLEIAARADMSLCACASEIILQSRDLIDVMADKPQCDDPVKVILAALRTNGERGRAEIEEKTPGRYVVRVEGDYYGIWDAERRTFVD